MAHATEALASNPERDDGAERCADANQSRE